MPREALIGATRHHFGSCCFGTYSRTLEDDTARFRTVAQQLMHHMPTFCKSLKPYHPNTVTNTFTNSCMQSRQVPALTGSGSALYMATCHGGGCLSTATANAAARHRHTDRRHRSADHASKVAASVLHPKTWGDAHQHHANRAV